MLGRPWVLREIAAVVGGTVADAYASRACRGVTTDTRALHPGDLFVALRGERFDGHAFAAQALDAGAVAVLAARNAQLAQSIPAIHVDDTLHALGELASAVVRDRGIRVVGVTGSCGKTTAKELIAAVLRERFAVGATPGNWNNLVGVPLSVFALPDPCEVAVLELATSASGEIRRLSHIVRPEVGIITNVAAAHLQGLGSVEGVREAKAEILSGMSPGGTLILNADDPSTPQIAARFSGRVVLFGSASPHAAVRATDVTFDAAHHTRFRVNGDWEVDLGLYGHAAVANALVAITVGLHFGVSPEEMTRALRGARPAKMRMELVDADGVTIINDAYNANPRSMAEALRAFENGSFAGRKVAVLGDMLELGAGAEAEHRALGERVARSGANLLYAFGEHAAIVRAAAIAAGMPPEQAYAVTSHDEVVQSLRYVLRPGDVVLVKGSRGTRMERVAHGLLEARR